MPNRLLDYLTTRLLGPTIEAEVSRRVALATDFNPGSSPTRSMPLIMTLACLKMGLTPDQALWAATMGGAWALERFDLVTTMELRQMLQDREAGKTDFVLVNCLDEMIYDHAHIPGSINIPLNRFEALKSRLGPDKDKLIVPY